MKIQFESNLDYQQQAISSVVDLFRGQGQKQSLFSVSNELMGQKFTKTGIGNCLELDIEAFNIVQENRITEEANQDKKQIPHFYEILANLQKIQIRNGLAPNDELNSLDFDIEMETGTGKTYVYLRSILELNKQYGFSKFIIVVPNIAIKEGVFHSLEITKEHFAYLFQELPYEYFVYDSSKLDKVRSFVTNSILSIMVINIDAFKKDLEKEDREGGKKGKFSNVINKKHDKFDGEKPIDVIAETNPIVIIDEPQ